MDRIPSQDQLRKSVVHRIAYCWHDIAVQLGFTVDELDQIANNHRPVQVKEYCKDMLGLWIRKTTGITAKQLISAIKEVGDAAYASELQHGNQQRLLDISYLESEVVPRIAANWYDIGLCLGIAGCDLDNIKQLHSPRDSICMHMLSRWLNRNQKHSNFRPTWRNLYNAMIALDNRVLAEELKEYVMSLEENQIDQEMLNIMLQAREKGLTINVRYGKAILVGSSAAGKSSFYRLLMKKKYEPQHISTGLADSHQLMFATKVDVNSSGEQVEFLELDLEKEITLLRLRLENKKSSSELYNGADTVETAEVIEKKMADTIVSTKDIDEVLTTVEKTALVTNENIPQKAIQETWDVLTFIDSGGQPQYITMLPAVNSSSMVAFVVYNMEPGVDGLNKPVVVAHGDEKGNPTFEPYPIECTNLELIETLITITSNSFVHKKPFLDEVCIKKGSSCSFLSFIGTHKDKVCEDEVQNISKIFDTVVSAAGLQHVWIYNNQCLIPVDNTSSGKKSSGKKSSATENEDKHVAFIRKELYNLIQEQDIYSVPIVWVLLELEIRKLCKERKCSFIMYSEIKELCKQRELSDDEEFIKNALRFHHLFGVLLYYEEVDGMRDIVITNHQWLLDKLTNIAYHSFSEFRDTKIHEDFEHKGIFHETLLDKIDLEDGSFEASGIDLKTFNAKKCFMNLLEHLRIVAPIKEQKCTIRYFMPSLLSTCNTASLPDILHKYGKCESNDSCNVEPLLIQFTKPPLNDSGSPSLGVLPRGVFCCLVVELMQKDIEWKLQWSKDQNELFCNLVTFYTSGNQCYVTLIDKMFYLEVQIRSKEKIHSSTFLRIRSIIWRALNNVGEKLSFYKYSLRYGFLCHECGDMNKHITTVSSTKNEAFCCYDKPTLLNFSHKVWIESGSEPKSGAGRIKFAKVPDYPTLTKYFERVTIWKELAAYLLNDIHGNKIDEIERNNRDVGDCRGAMIKEYLRYGDVSWEKVLSCLRSADYTNLAIDIEQDLDVGPQSQLVDCGGVKDKPHSKRGHHYVSRSRSPESDIESIRYNTQSAKIDDREQSHSRRSRSHHSRSRSPLKRHKKKRTYNVKSTKSKPKVEDDRELSSTEETDYVRSNKLKRKRAHYDDSNDSNSSRRSHRKRHKHKHERKHQHERKPKKDTRRHRRH